MKKTLCFIALLGLVNYASAQDNTNPWPSTGSIGIGTLSPGAKLEALSTTEQLRLSYNTTNNLRFVVNATGNASITPSGGNLFIGSGATITTAGAFYGTNFYNYINSSNAAVGLSTTGTSITRNIADANSALIINQANSSSTGRVVDFQFGGSSIGSISTVGNLALNGGVSATDLRNITSSSNSIIQATAAGTLISRNVADANPALTITQSNAGSTGDILRIRNSIGTPVAINKDGNVGIGIASPVYPLDVRGDVNIGTVLRFANNTATTFGTTDTHPTIYSTAATGTAYPFLGAGNLILQARSSGSARDVVFVGSLTPAVQMVIQGSTGNVGIGTATPATLSVLQVQKNINNPTIGAFVNTDPGVSAKALISVGSTPATGGTFGSFEYLGAGRTGTGLLAADRTMLRGNGVGGLMITAENAAGNIAFATGGASGNNERMRIASDGNISIGTTDPKGYKLAVNGSAVATSMTVKLNSAWPDYVFKKEYKLPALAEVKDYIDKNHHLPDMPSAAQVEKDGLNLGEINTALTKKVEELTLYLIEKNEQLNKQQKEIDLLKEQFKSFLNADKKPSPK